MKRSCFKALGIAETLFVIFLCSGWGEPARASANSAKDLSRLLKTYTEVLTLAEENYADSVNSESAIYRSILGMLQRLDPHSNFFDSKTYQQFREDQSGDFYGLGISYSMVEGKPVVMATLSSTPAHRSGMCYGDIILEIDGKSCQGMTQDQVMQKLRGPIGSLVQLTIDREGTPEPLHFSITRGIIPQYSVPFAFFIRPGVAYVRIESFTETTEKELNEALAKLGPSLQGLVLDLRGNPGGSLQAAIGVSDKFLRMGQEVLVTKGRMASANNRYVVPRGSSEGSYALVVLINAMSASAAEIVAGAIQDHDRGLILGETSFGKGLVQTVFDLSQGAGVALTTAKWYTPSGRLIQRDYMRNSYYDYFSSRGRPAKAGDICHTDSGREVFGGGGISPDFRLSDIPLDSQQVQLLNSGSFLSFIRQYRLLHADLTTLQPDDNLLREFKDFLLRRKYTFEDAEFLKKKEFIKRQLRYEHTLSRSGYEEAQKILLEGDVQVLKGVELLPEARALFRSIEKVMASQKNSRTTN